MKRLLLFFIILVAATFCSACINNYAVLRLNQIAQEYSNRGDFTSAISRLESSVDLDGNIYESRYNLAAAYLLIHDCDKALTQINEAKRILKKDDPAIYYIIGNANMCLANQVYNIVDDKGNKTKLEYKDPNQALIHARNYADYLNKANEAYDKYVTLAPATEDTQGIIDIINDNKSKIKTSKSEYGF